MSQIIEVISPSSSISSVPVSDIEKIKKYFGNVGYEIRFADDFHADISNTESKVQSLHKAFTNPDVDIVICAHGGFHAINLLEKLDYDLIKKNAKPFIGYSDITVLLNAIYAKTGVPTYYGPLFWSFNNSFEVEYTIRYFQKALNMSGESYEIEPARSIVDYMDHKHVTIRNSDYWVINSGIAEGILVGGHIPTLNLLQGSQYFPDLKGKILLLEMNELDGPYSIDIFSRLLMSLKYQSGFDQIRGMLIGAFHSRCQITMNQFSDMIRHIMKPLNIPVIANCNFGHIIPILTLQIGGKIKIDANASVKMTVSNT